MKQKALKLKESGSLLNWMMSNNSTAPVVGQGMTELRWSDRAAYEVLKVIDERHCVCQRLDMEVVRDGDPNMAMDPNYKENGLCGEPFDLVFRYGHWYRVWENGLYRDSDEPAKKKEYEKMNVIFGIKEEYRDPSF